MKKIPSYDPVVKAIEHELISWRRHLHQFPELSFKEFETTDFIEEKLREFGNLEILRSTRTGIVGQIVGSKSGIPHIIAIRADIDALPIQEENDLSFCSRNPGVMHACGHDGHTAILLGLAKILSSQLDQFCGEVRFIFQHAEELPPGGAIEMLQAGVMESVDLVLGLHLSTQWDTGVFGIKSGVLTSAVDRFDIEINGKGGHCAYPEQCVDPLITMAELILALQTIVSRKLSPTDPAVISVCMANAGTAYNIIPDKAFLSASVRSFSPAARLLIEQEVNRITDGIAQSTGTHCLVKYEKGYPSVINNPQLAKMASEVLLNRFGEEHVTEIGILMPGEDFSYLIQGRPGFFVELGSRNAEKDCTHPHHNPNYCLDEDALLFGLQYSYDMVMKLLNNCDAFFEK